MDTQFSSDRQETRVDYKIGSRLRVKVSDRIAADSIADTSATSFETLSAYGCGSETAEPARNYCRALGRRSFYHLRDQLSVLQSGPGELASYTNFSQRNAEIRQVVLITASAAECPILEVYILSFTQLQSKEAMGLTKSVVSGVGWKKNCICTKVLGGGKVASHAKI